MCFLSLEGDKQYSQLCSTGPAVSLPDSPLFHTRYVCISVGHTTLSVWRKGMTSVWIVAKHEEAL